jgi:hypothetical protein
MADGSTMDVRLLDGDNQEEQQEEELHISHPLHGDAPYWCGTLILIIMNYTVATLITGGRNIIVISYITMLMLTGPMAFRLRSWTQGWWRWGRYVLGVGLASFFSGYKSALLIPALLGPERTMASTVIVYALTALWECSNAVLVLGGAEVLHKSNIRNYQQAVAAGAAPCQVKFMTTEVTNSNSTMRRWLHVALWLGAGLGLREALKALPALTEFAQDSVILEAELQAFLLSCMVLAFDLPCLVWGLLSSCGAGTFPLYCHRMEMVLPYGSVYLSSSPRDFWRKWSRPASQMIRHMVYYPLGGSSSPYVSIPIMFLINANSHLQLGHDLLGTWDGSLYWLLIFLVLGAAVLVDVYATRSYAPVQQLQAPQQAAVAENSEGEAVHVIHRPGSAEPDIEAGWGAEQEPPPTLPHPCNAVASVVPTAQPVPEAALVKCKNCNVWFRYANDSSSLFPVY